MEYKQITILIIDDEEAIRQSYSDFLEDKEYRVLSAENGRVGIEIFNKEDVDLVLVDLRMPEVDGLEVLDRIKADSPDTPLIVVSGTGVISDVIEALHKGAWDYLLKPIDDFSILIHSVNNVLEKAKLKRENQEYQEYLECILVERTHDLIDKIKILETEVSKKSETEGFLQNSLLKKELVLKEVQRMIDDCMGSKQLSVDDYKSVLKEAQGVLLRER